MSSSAYEVPKTYSDAIKDLADAHRSGMHSVTIYYVPDPAEKTVMLIEVSDEFPEAGVDRPTPPGGMEKVIPVFPMGPSSNFPYHSEVTQMTTAEWENVKSGNLKLNRVWDLSSAREV